MTRIWQIDLNVDTDGPFAVFHRSDDSFKRFGVHPDSPMEKKLNFLKVIHIAQACLLEGIALTENWFGKLEKCSDLKMKNWERKQKVSNL